MTTRPPTPGTVRLVDGGWWDRLRRVDPRIWDGLLALGMVVVGVLAFALRDRRPDEPPAALGFALVVVAGTSLAWRRRAPLTVATIVCAAVATAALFGYWPEFVAPLWIAVYSAAAYTERDRLVRVLLPVALLTSVAISLGELADLVREFLPDAKITFAQEGGREESGNYLVDNSRLRKEFGIEYPPLRTRVREIINDVRRQEGLPLVESR